MTVVTGLIAELADVDLESRDGRTQEFGDAMLFKKSGESIAADNWYFDVEDAGAAGSAVAVAAGVAIVIAFVEDP